MRINVQVETGRPEFTMLEQRVIVNHPELTESGTCRTCEPLNHMPVERVGLPPFHPNCVCEVKWVEAK